ncbi:hypothetical protein Ddye_019904 [Dipteronia dyeriana]|uniref:Reverse transcriptase domain-containing protein n=1 Tax=Dipteronia dyeriana TaxID=168575 RepID=A0AAD9TYN5_9ROSI|nr:hypothetical protein Ddye_019904 [Dipteronia dyeriana]
MLDRAKQMNLIRGVVFGDGSIQISHLQFVDDTILFLDPSMDYLLNAKSILRCFELVLGLKINFNKSCLVRVVKIRPGEEDWAAAFRCVSSSLPNKYLGLPLEGYSGREALWNPVVHMVEHRLTLWKSALISKGGQLVLIKTVLSSLSSYFMTIFPIPEGVAKKLEKIQRDFFWNDGM